MEESGASKMTVYLVVDKSTPEILSCHQNELTAQIMADELGNEAGWDAYKVVPMVVRA